MSDKHNTILFKEHPYLFANGKFRAKCLLQHYEFSIDGWNINPRGFREDVKEQGYSIIHKPDQIALIARPIQDMTDEELKKLDIIKQDILSLCSGTVCGSDMLHLLSIGVYPGPQSDFDTGKVIKEEDL